MNTNDMLNDLNQDPKNRKFLNMYDSLLRISVDITNQRLARKWTTAELAKRAHVSKQDVELIEGGDPIQIEMLNNIADVLDLKMVIRLEKY